MLNGPELLAPEVLIGPSAGAGDVEDCMKVQSLFIRNQLKNHVFKKKIFKRLHFSELFLMF
jgi:hypothetical protein